MTDNTPKNNGHLNHDLCRGFNDKYSISRYASISKSTVPFVFATVIEMTTEINV